jgi:tetratricopeptide (TPR) repeat protein
VGVFGVLLASFPARNLDLWKQLASGRDLLRAGAFGPTWLYDLATYATLSVTGASGLVAVKAVLFGVIAVLMFRLSFVSGWRAPLAATGLAVLAMGNRLLVQPSTASVLCLALTIWLLFRERPDSKAEYWPGYRLVLLFALWCNLDGRFVIGLGVVALIWLGQLLDERPPDGRAHALGRRVVSVGILIAVSCLSVTHVYGFRVPPEIQSAAVALGEAEGESQTVNSPFDRDYVTLFRDSSSALAYYPLLALGALSFLLNRRDWHWAWFLPWVALAVLSGLQVRTVPFFAVVAGPVTAWNLQAHFARHTGAPLRPRTRYVGLGLIGLLAVAFLVAAWPGWLQGPPFEPRRWSAECPPAVERGAEFLRRTHAAGVWAPDTRTLHVSPDTLGTFAWFCPEDRGLHDDGVVNQLLAPEDRDAARERLRALRVARAVVYVADPSAASRAALDRFLADPYEWPVLSLSGGLVVFGWRDPARAGPDPYAGWEVDFERLAFRPDETERAPGTRPSDPRPWWAAFWKPAYPSRPQGRDEATVLLRKAEVDRSGPVRQLMLWETGQFVGLVGAAGGWAGPAGPVDGALRLTLMRPPLPEGAARGTRPPPVTELVFALQQRFAFERGRTPVGVVYAAVRAARRAVAENPTDPNTHLALGQAYGLLANATAEFGWSVRVPQLKRVRQVQASAALNRAIELNPRLAQAHLELARLYRTIGCLDLAVHHLRVYRDLPPRWGGPRKGDRFAEAIESELEQLTKLLDQRTRTFAAESARSSVGDRALLAVRLELGGMARDGLLKSDVGAFGAQGTELETDLLLRTGRPDDVLEFLTPEVSGSLGDLAFHWSRAQARLALGEYDEAEKELGEMVGPGGRLAPLSFVGEEVAGLVGKSLLDEQPGGSQVQQLVWRALSRSDLQIRIADTGRKLGLQADITVLRGVVALEAGNVPRAREAFRAALAFAPNRWAVGGQLEFSGRRIAWDCLALVDRDFDHTDPHGP